MSTAPITGRDRTPTGPRILARVTGTGTIDKGFVFLMTPDGVEYFLHQSSCAIPLDELTEDQILSVIAKSSMKGPRAIDARRLTPREEEDYATTYGNR